MIGQGSDKPAIKVRGLVKEYPIYESIGKKLASLFGLRVKPLKVVRALDEISFDVQRGEVVGIIGPNASGKTTLLKVLAGAVNPTSGLVEINGKLLPMLSLVGGFNMNLTGLENIYHKAAILGAEPGAIDRSIDSIIEFSGLGSEIDQPLRTYSSGMLLRLGFSIMIHMEFDILLVDEVMFVGDLVFIRKSEGAIRDLRDSGKTIVMASHSLEFIADFADRLIFLDRGKLVLDGSPEEVMSRYIQHCDRLSASVETGGVV
ncbi:MAG TPA: ABC transporter ATP-binding protein, partial [Proteobacteria bacterium]|nr:ABC transporter ATP-binding protein [Pseudomonadota bacterium]